MLYVEALNLIIDDGIEAARHDYCRPNQQLHRAGAIAGFEACRNKTVFELGQLLAEADAKVNESYREEASDHWYTVCYRAEIGWTCNVISCLLVNQGEQPIITPTARGMMKAVEIVGVQGQ